MCIKRTVIFFMLKPFDMCTYLNTRVYPVDRKGNSVYAQKLPTVLVSGTKQLYEDVIDFVLFNRVKCDIQSDQRSQLYRDSDRVVVLLV